MGKYCRQHIGKTFNDGKLTVVDGGKRKGYVEVRCKICAQDYELNGAAIYEVMFHSLLRGSLPCACAIKKKWTLAQYEILINRKIHEEDLPVQFLRFLQVDKQLSSSSMEMVCKNSGEIFTTQSINGFLHGDCNYGKAHTLKNQIDKFNKENPLKTVWDTGSKSSTSKLLGYHCSICEQNGFESVYTVHAGSLLSRNTTPCWCARVPSNVGSDYFVRKSLRVLESSEVKGVRIIGAIQKGSPRAWYTVFWCEVHGIYSRLFQSLKSVGCKCHKCIPPSYGYKITEKALLYVLQINLNNAEVLGYGITGNCGKRITDHKRNLKSIGATITNIQVFEGSGSAVLAVENAIKSLHTTGLLDCVGFRRESISIDRKDEVLEKCKKLKPLDNTDKLI